MEPTARTTAVGAAGESAASAAGKKSAPKPEPEQEQGGPPSSENSPGKTNIDEPSKCIQDQCEGQAGRGYKEVAVSDERGRGAFVRASMETTATPSGDAVGRAKKNARPPSVSKRKRGAEGDRDQRLGSGAASVPWHCDEGTTGDATTPWHRDQDDDDGMLIDDATGNNPKKRKNRSTAATNMVGESPKRTKIEKEAIQHVAEAALFEHVNAALHAAHVVTQDHRRHQQAEREGRQRTEFDAWLGGWKKHQGELASYYTKRHADGWERRCRELSRYKEIHGDCNNVPLDYRDPHDLTLGEWVEKQREHYWEGKLDEERVKRLEDQGFDFGYVIERFTGDEHFDSKLRELIEYKTKHLNCDPPIDYNRPIETLGQWVYRQRELYNEGTLEEERHVLLEEKGFVFEPGGSVERTVVSDAWKKNYKELVQFKRDHGHLEVPTNYRASISSANLNKWIGKQKNKFKHKQLSRNHIRLFDEIGLDLSARKKHTGDICAERWDNKLNELVAYREIHGHCNVPKSQKLGLWVRSQRTKFREGKMPQKRIQRLLNVGFDFNPLNRLGGGEEVTLATNNDSIFNSTLNEAGGADEATLATNDDSIFNSTTWMENYEAFKLFVEKNGHAEVQPGYKDDNIEGCLHTWIETQKGFFEEGILPQQNVKMLEELGADLSERINYRVNYKAPRNEVVWMNCFKVLKQFHQDKGHTDVPFDIQIDNGKGGFRNLAMWLMKQRENYKCKNLSAERTSLLESLGIDLSARKKYARRKGSMVHILGKMPDDNLWFEHEDGIRRRIPSGWKFPRLCLENMYILYHCGEKDKKISPMKLFQPSDMVTAPRDITNLCEIKLLCGLIDQECVHKAVVVNGAMTEEDARSCLRIGYPALNIPPHDDGDPRHVFNMSWSTAFRKKNLEARCKTAGTQSSPEG